MKFLQESTKEQLDIKDASIKLMKDKAYQLEI